MFTKAADKITNSLVKHNLVSDKNRIASQFGIEMLIVYLINIISAITIGFLLGRPLETAILLAALVNLRGYNGGIHAPNYYLCYIFSMLTIFASLKTIVWASSLLVHPYFLALFIFPFCGIVFLLSPVEDNNKPLDDIEKTVYRQRGLTTLTVTLAVSLVLIMIGLTSFGYAVGMAIIIIGTLMLAGYIKNRIILIVD